MSVYNKIIKFSGINKPFSLRWFISGLITGTILFCMLFSYVYLSESTFGQRCKNLGYEKRTIEWEICIKNLAN